MIINILRKSRNRKHILLSSHYAELEAESILKSFNVSKAWFRFSALQSHQSPRKTTFFKKALSYFTGYKNRLQDIITEWRHNVVCYLKSDTKNSVHSEGAIYLKTERRGNKL